jgi:hypothetical protein
MRPSSKPHGENGLEPGPKSTTTPEMTDTEALDVHSPM